MQDWLPSRRGTGTNNRLYSNLRAYADLGCGVEVVCLRTKSDWQFEVDASIPGIKWTELKVPANACSARFTERLAFWLGWPFVAGLNYRFKTRKFIQQQVLSREQASPGSWHHFEYVPCASASIGLNHIRSLWSHHDVESRFAEAHGRIRAEISGRKLGLSERRALAWLKAAEFAASRSCSAVLCIASHERDFLRSQWGCKNAFFLPMSLPEEHPPARVRDWAGGNRLRLLHLGRIDSLPSYRSLEFLLTEVWPRLAPEHRERLDLLVVGQVRETERARRILDLASNYPTVKILGYQEDIRWFYGESDLQVVGSSEATGLRTRIIESFAYGVPVLSTTAGAEGIVGMLPGKSILLADAPDQYAAELTKVLEQPSRLPLLAESASLLYREQYSRAKVAHKLSEILDRIVNP